MDLSSIMHHNSEDYGSMNLSDQPTDSAPSELPTEPMPLPIEKAENSSEPSFSPEHDELTEAAVSKPANGSTETCGPVKSTEPKGDELANDESTKQNGEHRNTVNEDALPSQSRKHSTDSLELGPAKRARTGETPVETSDDDSSVAYTIELDTKQNPSADPVSPCPALRSVSSPSVERDYSETPDTDPLEGSVDALSIRLDKVPAKLEIQNGSEPVSDDSGSASVIVQQNGVKMEEITGVTIREPTGYGNRGYQSWTNLKEDEPLTGRLPRTQSPESEQALDDLDSCNLPPGTRISVQKIDRPRLMTIESRLARLAPLDHHRELSPAPTKPETVGGERNLPVYHRAFRYEHAATNIACFPHTEYTQCDAAPHQAGISSVDRGGNVYLVGDHADIVTTDGQYGSAKSNVCLRGGGEWYFEIEVLKPDVRIGLGRRESTCEGPVGFDIYSYGLQGKTGYKLHCGRPLEFMEPFEVGDVIGFHVNLPVDSKPTRIHRPRVPFVYENQLWLESRDYVPISDKDATDLPEGFKPLDDPEVIPGSFCRIYRNGTLVGPLAEPLLDFRPPHSTFEYWLRLPSTDNGTLGYYPMISVYRGGAARLIAGPDFKYPPPPNARSLQDRYVEQTADSFAIDLTNEILFKRLDHILPRSTRRGVLHKSRTKKADSHHFA